MFSRGARCQALFFLDSLKISRLNEVEGRLAQISVKQFFRITGRSMKSPIPPKAEEVKYSTLCRKLTISRKLQLSVALERRSVLRPGAAKAPLADFDFLAHQRRHQVRHSNMSSSAASLAPSLAPLSSSVPVSLLSLSWCGVVWCVPWRWPAAAAFPCVPAAGLACLRCPWQMDIPEDEAQKMVRVKDAVDYIVANK